MALLMLLEETPRHGYELKSEFETRTGRAWSLNVGQVYTTLERLERDGLVAPLAPSKQPSATRNQRSFTITAAGREVVGAWLRTDAPPESPRDEFLVKVLVVAGRDPAAALDVIRAQRTALFARLQAHRKDQPSGDLTAELMHDAVAVRTEADLRWLDRCEARLNARRADGKPTRRQPKASRAARSTRGEK